MTASAALQPLELRTLTVKNRLFRSSLSGRFDNYDGSGTETRISWDVRFARAGIGAIISSNSPVHPRGLIVPGYAHIDRDDRIPFWRELVARVHEHDCRYIVQIAYSGRQRDIGGIEHATGLSSTSDSEPLHGFPCERMTTSQIDEVVGDFARAAYRAREAGADGVEVHGCNGYLITQFLSSEINDRKDDYGGPLENRARFALEVVRAIRAAVGPDYHLQFKISAVEHQNEVLPWLRKGNTLEESVQVCRWLEEAGVDAFHVSSGGDVPAPPQPRRHRGRQGARAHLRHDALERHPHVSQLRPVPHVALQPHLQVVVGATEPRRGRGHQPRRGSSCQGGRLRAGDLRRRLPDAVGHRRSHRAAATATRCPWRARCSRTPTCRFCSPRGSTARRSPAPTATSAS